jgi:hypothetical protein
MPSKDGYESLAANRQSFLFKKPRKGNRGGEITCCRLNPAAFITIKTPEYHPGMTADEGREAWNAYLRSFQPRKYPTV